MSVSAKAWSFGRVLTMVSVAFAGIVAGPSVRAAEEENDAQLDLRGQRHRWYRYVRDFRGDHNFALASGVTTGFWEVGDMGTIGSGRFSDSGVFTKLHYSFHLPLYREFGYFLGSTAGYHVDTDTATRTFKPVSSVMFPGLLAGLVWNVTPAFRLSSGVDAYLERFDGLREKDGEGVDPQISVTLQAYDFGVFVDIFYELKWALRLEAHSRLLTYRKPAEAEGTPVDVDLVKRDQWVGFGLVYHLL